MKNIFPIVLFLASLFLLQSPLFAQDMDIKGDTIRVSRNAFAELKFMSTPVYIKLTDEYLVRLDGNSLYIRPAVSNPKIGRIKVTEGPQNSIRQHLFIIVYDKDITSEDQNYDYSTSELIKKRIHYLSEAKKSWQSGAIPPNDILEPKINTGQNMAVESKHTQTLMTDEEALLRSVPNDQLNARVKYKVDKFMELCGFLCNKSHMPPSKASAIDLGIKILFEGKEDVIVQTTSVRNPEPVQRGIRDYLNRLTLLKYKRVEMKTSSIRFITKLIPTTNPDYYEGTVVVVQDFSGFVDYNILAYADKTEKAIKIIVKLFTDYEGGKLVNNFEVYLGNISVLNVPSDKQ